MPNMPITNYENWGNLVISWARDESKRPKTVKELNEQMAKANVGGSFSEQDFETVRFAQAPNDVTVQLFLPTAKAVDRAIQELKGGGRWMLPDFYSRDALTITPST